MTLIEINFLTIFPGMFPPFCTSMVKKAVDRGLVSLNTVDIRSFSENKHRKVDDYPYGGGCGMILTCQPVVSAYRSLGIGQWCVYLSAKGKTFTQEKAQNLFQRKKLTLLCGHYEGIDQRIIDTIVDEEISIGDYVLSGGEIPAMVLADAIIRLVPGVLASPEAAAGESHMAGLLEYPQYTRPEEFEGLRVPGILLSGNHREIDVYRHHHSILTTYLARPDMIRDRGLSEEEADWLAMELPHQRDDIIGYIRRGE